MKILQKDQIFHQRRSYGLHQKFKSQVVVLSHNRYEILIVLVLLIQVYVLYFYHYQILRQHQHLVEEVSVRKVLIENYRLQNGLVALNKA